MPPPTSYPGLPYPAGLEILHKRRNQLLAKNKQLGRAIQAEHNPTPVQRSANRLLTQLQEEACRENPSFKCPITHKLMLAPMLATPSGHSYERSALLSWLEQAQAEGHASLDPLSQQPLEAGQVGGLRSAVLALG